MRQWVPSRKRWPLAIWQSLRAYQWIKNGLLFAGLIFTGQWNYGYRGLKIHLWEWINWSKIGYVFAAFVVFCLLSSGGYLFNDIRDLENDRRHPEKSKRPIASGEVSLRLAFGFAVGLTAVGLGGSLVLSLREGTWLFGIMALAYCFLSAAYSMMLKQKVIADVLTIALLFVIRVVAGCVVVPVSPSSWIIVCTLFGALFMALCKRRHELLLLGEEARWSRSVLREYTPLQLDIMIAIVCACVLMSYALYAVQVPAQIGGPLEKQTFIVTLPLVIYGVFRYLHLAYNRNIGGSPELMFKDRAMLLCFGLWAGLVVIITSARHIP
ncbi:MAG: UbiA prenyltransferase family protein [Candidatus Methanosuratincola sp.]